MGTCGHVWCTVTMEQWAFIEHCLLMTKMVTHSKIGHPLYILDKNMQFSIFKKYVSDKYFKLLTF
jgi:hypothetical protein